MGLQKNAKSKKITKLLMYMTQMVILTCLFGEMEAGGGRDYLFS